jgi:F420-0:gamma-glutamyl ligase-like protein
LAFASLAGWARIIWSSVGLLGFFTGMLSGLAALAAPEAIIGDFAMGEGDCCATVWACAVTAMPDAMSGKTTSAARQHT